jgi:hypothetical protein
MPGTETRYDDQEPKFSTDDHDCGISTDASSRPRILLVCLPNCPAPNLADTLRSVAKVTRVVAIQPLDAGVYKTSTACGSDIRIDHQKESGHAIAIVIIHDVRDATNLLNLAAALVGQKVPVIGISPDAEQRQKLVRVGCPTVCGVAEIEADAPRFVALTFKHYLYQPA